MTMAPDGSERMFPKKKKKKISKKKLFKRIKKLEKEIKNINYELEKCQKTYYSPIGMPG